MLLQLYKLDDSAKTCLTGIGITFGGFLETGCGHLFTSKFQQDVTH